VEKDRLESYIEVRQQVTPCWEYHAAMLRPGTTHRRDYSKRDEKPANCPAAPETKSLLLPEKQKENSSKLNERRGNVYENKGLVWKTRERSGNVYENKGS
jgi:hypothetical protein